jgi:hypothetical protein
MVLLDLPVLYSWVLVSLTQAQIHTSCQILTVAKNCGVHACPGTRQTNISSFKKRNYVQGCMGKYGPLHKFSIDIFSVVEVKHTYMSILYGREISFLDRRPNP